MRLDTLDRALSDRLRVAEAHVRLRAAHVACNFAVRRSEVDERVVREALNSLLLGDARPPGPSLELSKLVDKLDAEYFRLGKASPGSTALRRFSQARAVQSLIYAWLSPDLEPTADAVYEAAMSLDDPSPLLKAVWATIE